MVREQEETATRLDGGRRKEKKKKETVPLFFLKGKGKQREEDKIEIARAYGPAAGSRYGTVFCGMEMRGRRKGGSPLLSPGKKRVERRAEVYIGFAWRKIQKGNQKRGGLFL